MRMVTTGTGMIMSREQLQEDAAPAARGEGGQQGMETSAGHRW